MNWCEIVVCCQITCSPLSKLKDFAAQGLRRTTVTAYPVVTSYLSKYCDCNSCR